MITSSGRAMSTVGSVAPPRVTAVAVAVAAAVAAAAAVTACEGVLVRVGAASAQHSGLAWHLAERRAVRRRRGGHQRRCLAALGTGLLPCCGVDARLELARERAALRRRRRMARVRETLRSWRRLTGLVRRGRVPRPCGTRSRRRRTSSTCHVRVGGGGGGGRGAAVVWRRRPAQLQPARARGTEGDAAPLHGHPAHAARRSLEKPRFWQGGNHRTARSKVKQIDPWK